MKTVGLAAPIRRALASLAADVRVAFIFGSTARGTDRAGSDVDLMVVSDRLTYPGLFAALQGTEAKLGRSVHPTLMSSAEWERKRRQGGSFVSRVVARRRVFIIGTEDDLD